MTPKAAGRSLFDDVTGQAGGRGRKRRSCDVQRPGRPRFRRLSEGTAPCPFRLPRFRHQMIYQWPVPHYAF